MISLSTRLFIKSKLNFFICFAVLFFFFDGCKKNTHLALTVTESIYNKAINIPDYSLGQGGLSSQPMIEEHLVQLKELHPKTIRFFIQEYYNIYPAKGKYNWEKLDRMFSSIVATGAEPIPCICFKPAVLYPAIDQEICTPDSWAEWDELIFQLVRHCKKMNFNVKYWEIGNEVDIGEDGGCPYKFTPEAYNEYYKHTSEIIIKADPGAKTGGPTLADYRNPIGDSLIAFCGRGNARLDFFSWHGYTNNPDFFRQSIRAIKKILRQYPALKKTETLISEWNMDLWQPDLDPYFQPAFILEVTKIFEDEGLSMSAYYHIRDYYVDPEEFRPFFSAKGTAFMAHWWNVMPQYTGIFDQQGRVRSSYYVFRWLSLLDGKPIKISGTNKDVKYLASEKDNWINILVWNFPDKGQGKDYDITLNYSPDKKGTFRIVKLDPTVATSNIEVLRSGSLEVLKTNPINLLLAPYEIKWIEVSR